MYPSSLTVKMGAIRDRIKSRLYAELEGLDGFDTAARIINFICSEFQVTAAELESPSRHAGLVLVRWYTIYFIKHLTCLSEHRIGILFDRDHSTITKALSALQDRIETDREVRSTLEALRVKLEGALRT